MSLPVGAGKLTTIFNAPDGDVDGFSPIIDAETLFSGITDFTDDIDTGDGSRARLAWNSDDTELAFDWIADDVQTDLGIIRFYAGTVYALSSDSARTVDVYAPNTRNAAYATGDTYGQYNAYDSSTKGYYPVYGDTGTTITNRTSETQTGSLGAGVSFVNNRILFDTINDGASVMPSKSLDGLSNFTVSMYVNHDDTDDQRWFNSSNFGFGPLTFWKFNSSTNYFILGTSDGDTGFGLSDTSVSPNVDIQYTFAYDGSTANIYKNGNLIDSVSHTGTLTASVNNNYSLGNPADNSLSMEGEQWGLYFNISVYSSNKVAYEYTQTSDNSAFWSTPTWTSGGTDTNFTGGISQSQTVTGAIKVKIPFTGGLTQAQTVSGDISVISASTDFTGGIEQGQTISGAIKLKALFTGGSSQDQEISGQIEIVSVETNFTGGSEQSQEIGGEQKIIIAFSGGSTQEQTLSGVFKIVGADTNFSGGVSQAQEISGQITVEDNRISFAGGISQDQDITGEFTIIIPPTAFTGGTEQQQEVSGHFLYIIEITPDIITLPGEIKRSVTVNGEIEMTLTLNGGITRTLTVKGELV